MFIYLLILQKKDQIKKKKNSYFCSKEMIAHEDILAKNAQMILDISLLDV